MNLRLLTLAALLGSSYASYAMDKKFKMPNADILRERLRAIGQMQFAQKTKIIDRLADQTIFPLAITNILEEALCDFGELMQKSSPKMAEVLLTQVVMSKPFIIEALLQDNPEGLQALKEAGLCTEE